MVLERMLQIPRTERTNATVPTIGVKPRTPIFIRDDEVL